MHEEKLLGNIFKHFKYRENRAVSAVLTVSCIGPMGITNPPLNASAKYHPMYEVHIKSPLTVFLVMNKKLPSNSHPTFFEEKNPP